MGLEGLVASIFVGFFAFLVGWLKGCEDEKLRIRRAFEAHEGYDYEEFFDVLAKHERQKANAEYWAKQKRKKKK